MAKRAFRFFLPVATLLFLSVPSKAQVPFDSLFSQSRKILNQLPGKITDIECDEEGNLFLLESGKHKVHKLFARRNYDSLQTVGGKGSGEEGFNHPSKIFVPNRQTLYLLDEMNRRIVVLNTNLRVLDDINFLDVDLKTLDQDADYITPISFAASPAGDLYLLNLEDLKIYKIANNGQVQTVFGGLDYGDGSLVNPVDLSVSRENNLFVSDTTAQTVSVFDLFGIFQYKLYPQAGFRWKEIATYENYLICFGGNGMLFTNLKTRKTHEVILEGRKEILDLCGTRETLYILTDKGVEFFSIPDGK